jgi:hypothetical protein
MTKACCLATLAFMLSGYGAAADQDATFFEQHVAPIL